MDTARKFPRYVIIAICFLLCAVLSPAQATFQKHTYQTGLKPTSVVSEDFNQDGRKDFAIAVFDEGQVLIHYGNADATFGAGMPVNVCGFPQKIVSGDFNHDGLPDLATINFPRSEPTADCAIANQPTITVIYGRAGGPTTASFSVAIESPAIDLAVGDIDGNGFTDLAALMPDKTIKVIRFFSTTAHTQNTFTVSAPGPRAESFALGDFNGDGKADLVVGICCSDSNEAPPADFIYVMPGKGDGTFGAATATFTGDARELIRADINNDGKADFLAALQTCAGTDCNFSVKAFRNNGNNTFTALGVWAFEADNPYTFPRNLVVGDFTGDGRDDVALLATDQVFETGADYLFVVPQRSDGTFSARAKTLLGYDLGAKSLAWTKIAGTSSLADLVEGEQITNQFKALINTTDKTGGDNCYALESVTVNICKPVSGSSNPSLVRLQATASVFNRVYRFEVWEGSTKLFTARDTNLIDTNISLPAGTHTLTFSARNIDSTSKASKSVTFTGGAGTACSPPATNGIVVCSPLDGSTVSNPVSLKAYAKVSPAVYRFELWIDGVKQVTSRDSGTINSIINLPAGTHRFDFVAYNSTNTSRFTKTTRATVK
ncbi:MAG: Na-Ca exchanger/integrin-beta4 [Acidobacteriales bacterium]|nr:Na-Ca exchanger/integrin-beta4 [Terriglobales bacterium]